MDWSTPNTKITRVASIDIGTNTILMLIADVDENCNLRVVGDFQSIARLGENLDKSGSISHTAELRTIEILKYYKLEIENFKVEKVFAVATSAMRQAKNSILVKRNLEQVLDIQIFIIDGETEATISFLGSIEDDLPSVVFDIGGGSSEIIIGEKGKIKFKKSLDIGAVTITEKFFYENPPQKIRIDQAYDLILSHFKSINPKLISGKVYAVAGTPTTLAMCALNLKEYDRNLVHNYFLKFQTIQYFREIFSSLTVNEIIRRYNIHPMRADVILAGTLILEGFCNYFGLDGVVVSDKGLRYGVINYFFCQELSK
ncbi:MAG: Ppx/GppA phosphatase family protein [Candidatus Kapaibacteriales bacterium]